MGAFVQYEEDIRVNTRGEVQIMDMTDAVRQVVGRSGVHTGQALLFTTSSTSAITTMEYEPGLLEDLPRALDRLFPKDLDYGHQKTWQDGNGHSHVRASFLKPDLLVPVRENAPMLGQWQQLVFVELDNKPRKRQISIHVWGRGP